MEYLIFATKKLAINATGLEDYKDPVIRKFVCAMNSQILCLTRVVTQKTLFLLTNWFNAIIGCVNETFFLSRFNSHTV